MASVSYSEIEESIILPEKGNPKKWVVVLCGYTPAGDPYQQFPAHFVKNWKIKELSDKHQLAFYIINSGESFYDKKYVGILVDKIVKKTENKKVILIGVSTGVEGIIKLWTGIAKKVSCMIGISGTYDLFSLPKESGEYRIHAKVWGARDERWKEDNPADIMQRCSQRGKTCFYLFSEYHSIYYGQMKSISEKRFNCISLIPDFNVGKEMQHDWNFWKHEDLLLNIERIFSMCR